MSAVPDTRALPPILKRFAVLAILIMAVSWTVGFMFPPNPKKWNSYTGMMPQYDDWFADLYHYDSTLTYIHTKFFFTYAERFAYPGPTAVPYLFFLKTGSYRLAVFDLIALWIGVVSALMLARALSRNGIGRMQAALFASVVLVTSWPLAFLIERANVELFVIGLAFAGALAYWKGNPRTAAILWGVAASMKIYPLVLLALFLRRDQIRTFAIGLATFAVTLLLSFWWIGPTIPIAAMGTIHGVSGFVSDYAYHARLRELNFDHSFLAGIKNPLAIDRFHVGRGTMNQIGRIYVIAAVVSFAVLYFVRVRQLPKLNQYAIFCISMIALPPVSYDYTLCHLYPVFGLVVLVLVRNSGRDVLRPGLNGLVWCFLILFTSQTLIFYQTFHPNGMIKAVALFAALILLVRYPFADDLVDAAIRAAPAASRHTARSVGV